MKIICTGDLHIGRRPTGLPEHVDTRALTPARCWADTVDRAIAERADLVALTGDVVDRANRFFEAYGPLERGLRRLAAERIHTVAVGGNHDFDVLPRLAETVGSEWFHLLGQGGVWERWTLTRQGRPLVHVHGWSFPAQHHAADPLDGYAFPDDDGVPVVGLLHADVDQPRSAYAPVDLDRLRSLPVRLWVVGHVHRPTLHGTTSGPIVLYPGSPQALGIAETGAHGIWSAVLQLGRDPQLELIPLSSVRYETLTVDVDGIAEPTELDDRVVQAVRAELDRVAGAFTDDGLAPRYLLIRLRLVGRTALHGQLEPRLVALRRDLELFRGNATALVHRVDVETRPVVELAALATGAGPIAVLAKLLLGLDSGDLTAEHDRLIASLCERVAAVRSARPYLGLSGEAPVVPASVPGAASVAGTVAGGVGADSPERGLAPATVDSGRPADRSMLERELRRQAFLLLDKLLSQQEAP